VLDLCVGGIVPDYAQPPSRTAWTSRAEWLPGLNPPATNTLVSSTTSPGPVVITVVWTPGDSLCKTPGDRHGRSRASLCPCCPTNSLRVCQPDEFRAGCNVSQPYAIDDDAPVPDRPAWSARPASIKNSRVYSRTAAVRAFHWYPRSFRKPDHGRSTARYVSLDAMHEAAPLVQRHGEFAAPARDRPPYPVDTAIRWTRVDRAPH